MVFYVCFTYTNVIVRDIKERLHIKIIITKRVILWVEFMKIGVEVFDKFDEGDVKVDEDEIRVEILDKVKDDSEHMCGLCPSVCSSSILQVFYFGTASWCKDKSNRCTMMFCYNISLCYNSARLFYILTVCDPEIFVVPEKLNIICTV